MPDQDRVDDAEAVRSALEGQGYVYLAGQIDRVTGEVRMNLVRPGGDTLWVNIRDQPPSPSILAEFCNEYEEIHALAFGLIHSCTRLRPLGYNEIPKEDFSPELIADMQHEYHYYRGGFWGLRIVLVLVILFLTGSLETAAHFLGW